jgi:acetyl-CoA carboxylase biotin carboxyl carrier protein
MAWPLVVCVTAEIPARVWKIAVPTGAAVEAGDEVAILESMKMEIPVEAPAAGVIRWLVAEGDIVHPGSGLYELD